MRNPEGKHNQRDQVVGRFLYAKYNKKTTTDVYIHRKDDDILTIEDG